jgi:hypothetical protein
MEVTLNGTNGDLVPRSAEQENNRELVNAPTPHQCTEVNHVTEHLLIQETVTLIPVLSMEDGLLGECGGNVPRPVVEDELTECVDARALSPNTVVNVVQVHPFKPNNVEQSNAPSMVDGLSTLHTVLVLNRVVVVSLVLSDTATTQLPNTTVSHAQEPPSERKPVTPITVPSMERTRHGLNGPHVVIRVVEVPRHVTGNVHHPSTEEKDALFLDTQATNANATPNFAP